MAVCLNTVSAYRFFDILVHDKFFVDKTGMIEMINTRINAMNRYICITKPRRFGKTSVLNMLGAYYGRAYNAGELFCRLKISSSASYRIHLNQYHVISLSLNHLPDSSSAYEDYISFIIESIAGDIKEAYPKLQNKKYRSITELLAATGDQYIFMIDEWDYIFSHGLYEEHQRDFLEFLRNLLKDQPYVALAYMTGVLPVKRYSTGSALNMFKEYTMLKDPFFEPYFGFTVSDE